MNPDDAAMLEIADENWQLWLDANDLAKVLAPLAPPAIPDPLAALSVPTVAALPRYSRARDLAGAVFPVSEAVILQEARKAGSAKGWAAPSCSVRRHQATL